MNLPIIKVAVLAENVIAKPLWMPDPCVNFSAQFVAVVPGNGLLSFQGQICKTRNNMLRKQSKLSNLCSFQLSEELQVQIITFNQQATV